ncbi:hypothetical protein A0H81_12942 [Grifola frondosa]|uniref:NADP-dependent oxidoreductase domain-containing protein n=1 Tax=Grifola frondosa TaxID=5627 RepID=A0A1C7LQH9_GRIFR|nr:hypothetical protein A0H81_12942 [Grifola frondosa]
MPLLGFGVYQNYTTHDSVLEAFKAGYRHVDSAQAYKNEAHVGSAVRESGLDREDVFITTKCISKTHGYESTLRAVDISLERFGFKYIDLYLIHDPFSGSERRLQTYRALQEARKAGKIRSVGVSNFDITRQIWISCIHSANKSPSYRIAKKILVVQAYCPLIRGNLGHPIITQVAEKHKRDPAQVLLRWSLQRGFVPLPKSATPARIHSNTMLYDFELDAEDMQRLDGLDKGKEGAVSWNPVDVD